MNYLYRLLILFLILGLGGCGKKVWPEPDASGEKFSISITHKQMQKDCLVIEAEITGNYRNLGRIILDLEISPEPCPTCPFLVSESIFPGPGSPEVVRRADQLIITRCGLDPDKYYRARIRAANVYSIIRDVSSRVVSIPQ